MNIPRLFVPLQYDYLFCGDACYFVVIQGAVLPHFFIYAQK